MGTPTSPTLAGALTLTALTPAPAARSELSDSHALHRRVLSAFDGLDLHGSRILWALPAPRLILIQAPAAPSTVLTDIGWAADQTTLDYTAQLSGLRPGDTVRYSLIGNPAACHNHRVDGVRIGNSSRLPRPEHEWEDWLRRQLDGALNPATIAYKDMGTARGRRRGGIVAHLRVLFTGGGTVVDADVLRAKVATGTGPAKGYGCGLLVLTAGPAR